MTERKDFAKGTKTDIATSEAQIKKMLQREGADAIAIVEGRSHAQVAFQLKERSIRFNLPLPARDDPKFIFKVVFGRIGDTPHPKATQDGLWVQANRERWRQLHLCIKAKLESIAQGIETFDEAFLAHVVMADGQTVGEKTIPEMQAQLQGAAPRSLLLGHG